MASLPPEVKATIIDLLKDTESTDASCREYGALSLLWPDVLFRIREHRFRTVNLENQARVRLLLEIIECAPSVGTLVRKVKVDPDFLTAARATLYTSHSLPLLFDALSRVVSITLLDLVSSNIHLIHYLPPTVTDVYLDISDITIDDVLTNLLTAFPAMESLTLRGNWSSRSRRKEKGKKGVVAHQGNLTQFAALRRLDMDPDILTIPALLERVMSQELFPKVECLIIEDAQVTSQKHVWHLDQLLRKWDATLKDLQLLGFWGSFGSNASITLPKALENLYFDIFLSGDEEVLDDDCISFFTRALENRCSAGRTLESLRVRVQIDWAYDVDPQDPIVRRFDKIVSAMELGVQHLDWFMRCHRQNDRLYGTYGVDEHWVYENIFPNINSRFIQAEGRNTYGTTANVVVIN
ncbi:hypothetical protein CYLTODRAFT_426143 [Cylindrobasidium torrendii FP15055 ss-10]|uniref:F-box domain-containing protein n=1 Tax=Cylindrobasidium torrendii FP15055 ss-10 TaxID=1314674 RepID=A0A0D7AZK0_9AGAR|nr:hypothetical protein CYLTODRAFT_426143 [Cylindrobasidium torrendii FP15055 ss-10]